jgi:NADH-quinone oxidoreductase subunit A
LFLAGAMLFLGGGLAAAWLIRPSKPDSQKLSSYESGEEAVGSPWGAFHIRFYVIALIFVLFEVEVVFLFPWAVIMGKPQLMAQTEGRWGWFAFWEALLFIFILTVGLAYAWKKGWLDWIRPQGQVPQAGTKVPSRLYEDINQKYAPAQQTGKPLPLRQKP